MKKLLFMLPLFVGFSVNAMNPMEDDQFSRDAMTFIPLAKDEFPTRNYPLHMTVTSEIEGGKVPHIPLKVVEIGSDSKDIAVTYCPYSNPSILLPIGVPMDMNTFIMEFVSGQPFSPSLNLSFESNITILRTGEVVGKKLSKVVLSPEKIKEDLLKTMEAVQAEGNKAVITKNKSIFSWIKSFLTNGNTPDWGFGERNENNYVNAAHLLAYCFSGKVNENPGEDFFLQAHIGGKKLELKKESACKSREDYFYHRLLDFRVFLKDFGFFLGEDGRLKHKK